MEEVDKFLGSVEQNIGGVPVNFAEAMQPQAVLVGEDVTELVSRLGNRIKIGSGLYQDGEVVRASLNGVLRFKQPDRYWVEHESQRYQAKVDEMVIGVVVNRQGESYKVDIGAGSAATLPIMAFHGATKRNHPNLEIGALVYTRVESANKYMEPELSCLVKTGPQKDWMTGQSLFGELAGGTSFRCSQDLCRRLLSPNCFVLEALGTVIAFEIAVGLNGWVWVNTAKVSHTVLASNILKESEHSDNLTIARSIKAVMKQLS